MIERGSADRLCSLHELPPPPQGWKRMPRAHPQQHTSQGLIRRKSSGVMCVSRCLRSASRPSGLRRRFVIRSHSQRASRPRSSGKRRNKSFAGPGSKSNQPPRLTPRHLPCAPEASGNTRRSCSAIDPDTDKKRARNLPYGESREILLPWRAAEPGDTTKTALANMAMWSTSDGSLSKERQLMLRHAAAPCMSATHRPLRYPLASPVCTTGLLPNVAALRPPCCAATLRM